MNSIVVFAEEPSGAIVARALAQKLDLGERTLVVEHQGWGDLQASFPRKMKAWSGKPRFIVMRDNDGADCIEQKRGLASLIPSKVAGRVKIRLVVQELESWYIGDPQAMREAGLISDKEATSWSKRRQFRRPDEIRHAKRALLTKTGLRGQLELAHLMGPRLELARNLSPSFNAFVGAMKWAGGAP
jgi:hypothetical protein